MVKSSGRMRGGCIKAAAPHFGLQFIAKERILQA